MRGSRFHAYQIPYQRVDYKYVDCKLPIGWWRSVYDSQNAFAKECFVDQVARKLEKDPGLYRVELLTDSPRHKRVLQEVLLMSKWDTPTPKDKGRGCAVHKSFNSYVAMSCELSLRNNTPVIEKVYVAVDCGLVVHPNTVEAQVQGSIVFGMMATLFGEINVDKGQVMEEIFISTGCPRFSICPK